MKIHTGDLVLVITGKDKGKQGQVVRVFPEDQRVVVEGVNMRVRHIKKTPQQAGSRVTFEASMHVSNVMVMDPKSKKPTRIGYKIDAKTGVKQRIAKESGEVIVKAVTKAEKKTVTKKDDAAKPVKKGFWKKGEGGGQNSSKGGRASDEGGTSFTTAHRSQGG